MSISNNEIAKMFNTLGDLLAIEGANPFRVRAYYQAARAISDMSKNIMDLAKAGADLTEIPGVGNAIAAKIKTIVETGTLPQLTEAEKHTPKILSELMQIEGLGPKRVQALYEKLHIKSFKDLQNAIDSGKVQKLPGFGEKTENLIKAGVQQFAHYTQRYKLADVIKISEPLIAYLKKAKGIDKVEIAGSYRRQRETVGDLDVLTTARNGPAIIHHFINFLEVAEVLSQGTTRSSVRLRSGLHVDLRVVPKSSYGAALFYFTGSKAHNIAVRKIANDKQLKINEYGVFKKDKSIASKTETDVYRAINLPYIEPELREDRGEIEAAQRNKLPTLITLKNICGDLHAHTNASDGNNTLEEMATAAAKHGYQYLAITDHSKHLTVAHGLDEQRLLQQIKTIDQLNEKLNTLTLLKSCEVDILEDGTLDITTDVLKELDLTVCSVHYKFGLSRTQQTERILRAMDNPYFTILGHPTGRLINRREPYAIDLPRIMQAAKERGCFLELNAQPERLDLNDVYCKLAKEIGVKLVISTDAHSTAHFNYIQFGINQARRGWLTADDVVNTLDLAGLKKLLHAN